MSSTRRNVLFVFTSADKILHGKPSGWFLPEAAHPYYILAPHHNVDFAAPQGPNPPVDQESVTIFKEDQGSVDFLKDDTVVQKLANAKLLKDVSAQDYDAIFYVGGHGPVMDLAIDPVNIKLASDFYRANKPTAAVCNGLAALVGATTSSGDSIIKSRRVTGFSNEEEEIVGAVKDLPFLVEDKLKELGGQYEKASELWGAKVIVDGHLITGQNPASGKGVGEAILKALA